MSEVKPMMIRGDLVRQFQELKRELGLKSNDELFALMFDPIEARQMNRDEVIGNRIDPHTATEMVIDRRIKCIQNDVLDFYDRMGVVFKAMRKDMAILRSMADKCYTQIGHQIDETNDYVKTFEEIAAKRQALREKGEK